MMQNRKDDSDSRARYRSDRFFMEDGNWYFHTREKTVEGPFQYKLAAENRLQEYIKVMLSGWLEPDSTLSVEPQG